MLLHDHYGLFDQAHEELRSHLGHKLTLKSYGGDAAPDEIAVECENCQQLLIGFLSEGMADERKPDERWKDNAIQFPRLITEILATQNRLDMMAIAESMDLEISQINELFLRAQGIWDEIKQKTGS